MFDFPKVIGQGSYGYIHYPHLITTEDEENQYSTIEKERGMSDASIKVSKILEKEDAMDEMKKYNLFHEMDPACDFHLGEMTLAHPSKKNNTVLATLEHGQYIVEHLSEYRLILMNYGGPSIRDYANDIRSDFIRFPHTHNNTESVVTFWKETVRLVQGVKQMIDHHIVHHDIKPSNVVYHLPTNRLNYIDFGLVNRMDNIFQCSVKNEYDFTIFFYNMPPELFFYNQLRFDNWRNMSTEERKEQLANCCTSWIKEEEEETKTNKNVDDHDDDDNEDENNKYSFSDSLYMSERELKYINDFEEYLEDLTKKHEKTSENCFNYCTTHDAIPDVPGSALGSDTFPPAFPLSYKLPISRKPPLHDFMMEGFADFMMHDIDLYTDFQEFIYASMHTMDIYGLGHTLLYILIRTYALLPGIFVYEMYQLLREMLDNNLTRRISIQHLQERFSSVLLLLS